MVPRQKIQEATANTDLGLSFSLFLGSFLGSSDKNGSYQKYHRNPSSFCSCELFRVFVSEGTMGIRWRTQYTHAKRQLVHPFLLRDQ